MELTSKLTITSMCPDRRTGTTHGLSGTGWTITGTTETDNFAELVARLPKLRKDARTNVETVLHELIADKTATIPQICARTGMALRTINNALATLRGAGIVQSREVAEKVAGTRGEYTEKYTEKPTEKGSEYTESKPDSAGNLTETEARIVAILHQNKFATQGEKVSQLGITRTYVTKIMGGLQARKIIRRVGPDKGGHWEVLNG